MAIYASHQGLPFGLFCCGFCDAYYISKINKDLFRWRKVENPVGFSSRIATAAAKSKILARHLMAEQVVRFVGYFARNVRQQVSAYQRRESCGRAEAAATASKLSLGQTQFAL